MVASLANDRKQPFYFDPFSNNGNFNVVAYGRSGSGKTSWINENIYTQLAAGAKIWVIGSDDSYLHLSKLMGGHLISLERWKNCGTTPFWVKERQVMDAQDTARHLRFVSSFIYSLIYPDGEYKEDRDYEKKLISRVVGELWDEHLQSDNFPTVGDVVKKLNGMTEQRTKCLALQLFPFSQSGRYGNCFNGQHNSVFDSDLVVFNEAVLGGHEHLQGLIRLLLLHWFNQKMHLSDRFQRKVLVLDEVSWLLDSNSAACTIGTIAREARPHLTSVWFTMQCVNDLKQSSGFRSIFDDAYWHCHLELEAAGNSRTKSIGIKNSIDTHATVCGKGGEFMISHSRLGSSNDDERLVAYGRCGISQGGLA